MHVSVLPKNLQGLPFETWAHFHSSTWCSSTSLFSFSLLHLVWWNLSDEIPFTSFPFIKSSLSELGLPSSRKPSYAHCSGLLGCPTSHHSFFFSIIPQLFSALTSLPVNMQWPWRQPLLYLSFCAPSPSQPWWESARPQPGSLCLLLLPKGHSFWYHSLKNYILAVFTSEFPSFTTPHLRYWLFNSW